MIDSEPSGGSRRTLCRMFKNLLGRRKNAGCKLAVYSVCTLEELNWPGSLGRETESAKVYVANEWTVARYKEKTDELVLKAMRDEAMVLDIGN